MCSSVCSSVRSQKGCSANCEINRAASPTAGRQHKAAKKALCEGVHGPQLLPSLVSDFFVFCRDFYFSVEVWESGRESRSENAARGCDAENPAPTARSTVPAPGARGHVIHVIRAREGGSRKAAPLPHPPRCKYVFCFLKRGDLQ